MALVPDWLKGVIATMQERSDAKYQDELKTWKQAATDWIAAGVITRAAGETVTMFSKPIPARVVFSTDENGNLTQTSVVDPSIQMPELPPYVPTTVVPPTAFTTGAPAQSDMIAETLRLVKQIAAYFPAGGVQ